MYDTGAPRVVSQQGPEAPARAAVRLSVDLFDVTFASFAIAIVASALGWRASSRSRALATQVIETERAMKGELERQRRAFADHATDLEQRHRELRAILAH